MLQWGLGAGIVLGLVVGALHSALPHLFTDDPAVLATAAFLLLLAALMQPLNGVVFTLDGILIGAGDLRFLAKAMILASVVFAAGALAVVATDAGIGWLWAALAAWMTTRLITLGWRYRSDAWIVLGT
jgi:Na+-driven multidrug efflux pump